MVLDIEEDEEETLVILGRPFFITSGCLIDFLDEKVTIRVENDEEVTLDALKSVDFSPKVQTCNELNDLTSQPSMNEPLRTNPKPNPIKVQPFC